MRTAMTLTTSARPRGRRGFTLVELLVAMALIIFIMVILTEAFTAGTGVFRTLKAQGDLTERLRQAANMMGDDLRQPHFDQNTKKLSNLFTSPANVPAAGYFYVNQSQSVLEGTDGNNVGSYRMGPPPPAAVAPPALCFSVRRGGIQPSDYFVARIPGFFDPAYYGKLAMPLFGQFGNAEPQLFTQGPLDYIPPRYPQPPPAPPPPTPAQGQSGSLISLWAEVGWFLTPELGVTTSGANGLTPMQLYTLRRRVRVVVPDDPPQTSGSPQLTTQLNSQGNQIPIYYPVPPTGKPVINLWGARYAEVSCQPDPTNTFIYFNSAADLMNTARQAMPQSLIKYGDPIPSSNPPWIDGAPDWVGDDIVLPDVVSFNVRVLAKDNANTAYSTANGGILPSNNGNSAWQTSNAADFTDVPAAWASYQVTQNANGTSSYSLPATVPALALPAQPTTTYNTGSFSPANPPPYLIQSLEITIRVWDFKTSQTRQITIVQDM